MCAHRVTYHCVCGCDCHWLVSECVWIRGAHTRIVIVVLVELMVHLHFSKINQIWKKHFNSLLSPLSLFKIGHTTTTILWYVCMWSVVVVWFHKTNKSVCLESSRDFKFKKHTTLLHNCLCEWWWSRAELNNRGRCYLQCVVFDVFEGCSDLWLTIGLKLWIECIQSRIQWH